MPSEIIASRSRLDWIAMVIRDICEMPDRFSPDDFPEAMVVTPDELRDFIEKHVPPSETQAHEGYPGIAHDLETMRTALRNLLVQYEGVYDCVDNDGQRYQSQGAADAEAAARSALKEGK